MVRYLFQVVLLLAVAAYAWRRGGWPERTAAVALVVVASVDRAYHALVDAPQFRELDIWHMSLDLALLSVTVGLALRAPRVWVLWLASLQMISALGHFLHLLQVAMPPLVYGIMTVAPSYLQILLLAIGTYLNDRLRLNSPTTSPPYSPR